MNEALVQAITKVIAKKVLKLKYVPAIKIMNLKGGGTVTRKLMKIPHWVLDYHKAFVIYHVCHKLLHLKLRTHRHTTPFKMAEIEALKRLGITVRYVRAYADELIVGEEVVYKRTPVTDDRFYIIKDGKMTKASRAEYQQCISTAHLLRLRDGRILKPNEDVALDIVVGAYNEFGEEIATARYPEYRKG